MFVVVIGRALRMLKVGLAEFWAGFACQRGNEHRVVVHEFDLPRRGYQHIAMLQIPVRQTVAMQDYSPVHATPLPMPPAFAHGIHSGPHRSSGVRLPPIPS